VDLAANGRHQSNVDAERRANPVTYKAGVDDSSVEDSQRTEDDAG